MSIIKNVVIFLLNANLKKSILSCVYIFIFYLQLIKNLNRGGFTLVI